MSIPCCQDAPLVTILMRYQTQFKDTVDGSWTPWPPDDDFQEVDITNITEIFAWRDSLYPTHFPVFAKQMRFYLVYSPSPSCYVKCVTQGNYLHFDGSPLELIDFGEFELAQPANSDGLCFPDGFDWTDVETWFFVPSESAWTDVPIPDEDGYLAQMFFNDTIVPP